MGGSMSTEERKRSASGNGNGGSSRKSDPNDSGGSVSSSNVSRSQTSDNSITPSHDFEWLQRNKLPKSHGVAYFLPPTDKEVDRYQMQHELLCIAFGKYSPHIAEVLTPGAKVLDVGCGSGEWMCEMAIEFAKVDFVGIDIANIFPISVKPNNCQFKLGNVLDGLPFPDDSFEFVHIRVMALGIKTERWPELLREGFRVLKPGGHLQVMEADPMVYNCGNAKQWFKGVCEMLAARGLDPFVGPKLHVLLSEVGFTSVYRKTRSIPIGWCGYVGKLMLDNTVTAAKAGKATLSGITPVPVNEYDQYIDSIGRACANSNAYCNFYSSWGKKPLLNLASSASNL
ncbi:S-adenosyl-L-methionine-dependent methyltransferase [Jimgerdemannia flammicorona]|uniref:S-adenosyl-L-methionine-dependent methyltransferase n=1 Tax=Jimgerdemannia flammicorona TaxID=994334 RepID=A0A433QW22_9FUNG|nr:S-adenosyl-L-methionine-dependent methyltransferase [Jimgerdemannia flammicorona]